MVDREQVAAPTWQRLFAIAFPFGFVLDADLRIVLCGASLLRVCPAATTGRPAAQVLDLVAPTVPFTFRALVRHPEAHVTLAVPGARGGPMTLRGQFVVDGEAGLAFFLGSPLVQDAAQLTAAGLELTDFAVHDAVLDRLFLAQAGALARADAARLDVRLRVAEAARRELAAAERALASQLDAVPDLLLRLAPDGVLLAVRPAAGGDQAALAADCVGRSVDDAFPALGAQLERLLAGGGQGPDVHTVEYVEEQDGQTRSFEARVARTSAGELLVLVRDVTEQRELASQLAHQAWHDPLTGLANRDLFTRRVATVLDRGAAGAARGCVLFVDLDDFKKVNDVLGHATGDALLMAAAERMRAALRPGDVVARLGGDEFAVLLPDVEQTVALDAARRISESLAQPFPATDGRPELRTSASVGVAVARRSDTVESLLSHADMAMYAAKAAGKGCFRVFDDGMREQLLASITAEMELRAALARGELFLDYQVQVHVPSGAVLAREALARWRHPVRGLVPPDVFIPLAEATGLIVELGAWALEAACRAAAAWPCGPDGSVPGVSVNVSARQLADPAFNSTVERVLADTGLSAPRLTLEITETAMVATGEADLERLAQLQALGVRVSLDDFGTGFSSLTHLRRLPVDELKIDKSFVDEIVDGRQARIAEGIVALATVLDLTVVAEGVETTAQQAALLAIGCTVMQGYHLGRPGPVLTAAGPRLSAADRPRAGAPRRPPAGRTPAGTSSGT